MAKNIGHIVYKNFENFYKDSNKLIQYIVTNTAGQTNTEKIIYARKVYSKEILNSYITISLLTDNIMNLLDCKENKLKFSMDNMIKNRLSHPEVTYKDYAKIPLIIKSSSKYYKSKSGYDVILFKEDNKYYKLVIKTTHNRKENFVKSLHLLNKERYNKY